MGKYTVGIDFGTLSGRAIVVDVENGNEISSAALEYKNGVISKCLVNFQVRLENDFALQDPDDYLEVLNMTISSALDKANIDKKDVIGIGIDFTSCTMMPICEDGRVLCQIDKYRENPHSWVKLWKHHAAQPYADRLNKLAYKFNEPWINRYGGKISSEWLFPKIMEIADKAPEIYKDAYTFLEATDWITFILTGRLVRNTCTLGYKAIYHDIEGFPSKEFFKALNPIMENVIKEKIKGEFKNVGEAAGTLNKEWAEKLGLSEDVVVAVGNVDAHVSAPAVKMIEPNKMLMIMGTSTCDILLSEKEVYAKGICGVVKNGVLPGYYGYESGQSAVGDIFGWFVDNFISEELNNECKERNISVHALLEEKASKLAIGESGLLTLDWFNGNRSILVDTNLTGMILGMDLHTKPEEIYRALIEGTAFGKRVIIDNYKESGININELYVCGGLPNKNKLLLQIYADVLNLEIKIADSLQTPALGSAIFASVAATSKRGGYDSIIDASTNMGKLKDEIVRPIAENVRVYDEIYKEFKNLHDYFGGGGNDVMKRLKAIKLKTKGEE